MTTVLHHLGARFHDDMTERFPDIEFVAVAEPLPDHLRGDIFVTTALGSPHLADLSRRGLRWVHSLGTGIERFPLGELPEAIPLTCTRGASGVPISEYVLAAMLDHEKQLATLFVIEPPAAWSRARLGGLAGQTVALVGLGGIGREVARRCVAFDMRVLGVRRRTDSTPVPGVELVRDLPTALGQADHVVVAVPVTAETAGLFGESTLAALRPGAHLINVARGAVIDQDALRRALDAGLVGRATLDVCEPEPLPAGHWLYTHPRVRLSPHVSWSSPTALRMLDEYFAANLARWIGGEPLLGIVDRVAGY